MVGNLGNPSERVFTQVRKDKVTLITKREVNSCVRPLLDISSIIDNKHRILNRCRYVWSLYGPIGGLGNSVTNMALTCGFGSYRTEEGA